MEIKIGVLHAPRELVLESDDEPAEIEAKVAAALEGGLLALTDTKGRRVVIPGDKVAYVEIGGGVAGHVGFRS